MKFSYPARTLGALAILAGLAAPALADVPHSAHSIPQLGQRHVNHEAAQWKMSQAVTPVSKNDNRANHNACPMQCS